MNSFFKILVVDDDPMLIKLLCASLKQVTHYEVRSAANGEEAFDIIKNWHPDLVISDVLMPICDGFELLKKVSSMLVPTPILFISGFASHQQEELIKNPNCIGFLEKPIRMESLKAILKSAEQAIYQERMA